MLFKKNPQASTPSVPLTQPMTEEQELEALESQLDFLRKPSEPPKLKEPQRPEIHVVPGNAIPQPQSVNTIEQLPEVPEAESANTAEAPQNATQVAQTVAGETAAVTPSPQPQVFYAQQAAPQPVTSQVPLQQTVPQAYALQNTNANPVAPAIVPPQAITNPNAVTQAIYAEKKEMPETAAPQVLTPIPLQEAAAESAAAQAGKTVQPGGNEPSEAIPRTQNKWGRQMDYKTAVVKSGGQNNSIGGGGHQEAAQAVKAQPIKNPLPTPKKHVAREMEFDLQPENSMMHFDLVDMSGIDHFDIN